MMERIAEASPRFRARIAGVFYLLTFLTGGVAVFASRGLIVAADAAATATNILAKGVNAQRWNEQANAPAIDG